ncbi:MAG: class I SAM-dependent methyltransferase [Lachnospiraceae bacterium]|nr:class I SAM-dependent methyltransferase [Lachnospiraceae bacterium]
MNQLESYYNKFNEDKRLNSRHGRVEYQVSMKYIHEYLPKDVSPEQVRILDVGAGTGRYAIPLSEEGYEVTAVEPVQHNLGRLWQKGSRVIAYKGNALHLKKCRDDYYDLTILFGPMYHLKSHEEKRTALEEAKRVTKSGGIIMAAYCMHDYAVLTYAFKERHIIECMENGQLDHDFKVHARSEDLYDYVRIEEIDRLQRETGLKREKLYSSDGAANYMRPFLNRLTEEEFEWFVKYQLAVCERPELMGAGAHVVDILKK